IVEALFAEFEHEIGHTLAAPEGRPVNAEDLWLFLHLTFEIVFQYRFLYRDLNELLSRHRIIETQFQRILAQQVQTAAALLEGLAATGALRAGRRTAERLPMASSVRSRWRIPIWRPMHARYSSTYRNNTWILKEQSMATKQPKWKSF